MFRIRYGTISIILPKNGLGRPNSLLVGSKRLLMCIGFYHYFVGVGKFISWIFTCTRELKAGQLGIIEVLTTFMELRPNTPLVIISSLLTCNWITNTVLFMITIVLNWIQMLYILIQLFWTLIGLRLLQLILLFSFFILLILHVVFSSLNRVFRFFKHLVSFISVVKFITIDAFSDISLLTEVISILMSQNDIINLLLCVTHINIYFTLIQERISFVRWCHYWWWWWTKIHKRTLKFIHATRDILI